MLDIIEIIISERGVMMMSENRESFEVPIDEPIQMIPRVSISGLADDPIQMIPREPLDIVHILSVPQDWGRSFSHIGELRERFNLSGRGVRIGIMDTGR